VGRHAGREALEGGPHAALVAEAVQVVGRHAVDQRDLEVELQEGEVVLAGLGHEVLALAPGRGRRQGQGHAAHQPAGVAARGAQQVRDERRGGGLAVRARDGHAAARGHQPPQRLGVLEDGQLAAARLGHLGVVVGHGGRAHQQLGRADLQRRVAEARVDAARPQRLGAEGGRRIAAGYDVAALGQQPGQRRQAAAADADAVDAARQPGRGLHGPAPAAASTTSATRRAASGRPTLSAAALIAGSRASASESSAGAPRWPVGSSRAVM
jgi:hypothetical protein